MTPRPHKITRSVDQLHSHKPDASEREISGLAHESVLLASYVAEKSERRKRITLDCKVLFISARMPWRGLLAKANCCGELYFCMFNRCLDDSGR